MARGLGGPQQPTLPGDWFRDKQYDLPNMFASRDGEVLQKSPLPEPERLQLAAACRPPCGATSVRHDLQHNVQCWSV
jgi:hypothetical protein